MASLAQKADAAEVFKVDVKRGDTAVDQFQLPLPDVIKIDVEGFEAEVMRGLEQTIARKRPVIAFEHIFLSEQQILGIVPSAYRLFFIGDDGLIYEGITSRSRGHDALLVPAENNRMPELKAVKM